MAELNQILTRQLGQWTRTGAIILSVACLAVGIAGGWALRGPHGGGDGKPTALPVVTGPASQTQGSASLAAGPGRLKEMADSQAAPLLEKLKADPNNADLMTSIGNLYYDAQQYPIAIDYYGRTLKARPSDAAVRTDMATAYWYLGNADAAIVEFNKALTYAPTNPNTLFNLGLVKWQGKMDGPGALADWQKLLAANPNYEAKDKVEGMMAEVKKHLAGAGGAAGK